MSKHLLYRAAWFLLLNEVFFSFFFFTHFWQLFSRKSIWHAAHLLTRSLEAYWPLCFSVHVFFHIILLSFRYSFFAEKKLLTSVLTSSKPWTCDNSNLDATCQKNQCTGHFESLPSDDSSAICSQWSGIKAPRVNNYSSGSLTSVMFRASMRCETNVSRVFRRAVLFAVFYCMGNL